MRKLAAGIGLAVSVFLASSASFGATPSVPAIKERIQKMLKRGESLKSFYASLTGEYGAGAIKPLIDIADDERNSDETRWAALFGIARVAGKESVGMIKKFMTHSSWMLRDAALKSAAALGAHELTSQIEQRLKDDALIVRTTAVQTIGHLNLKKSAPKLVDSLFDPANFHGGKALWIHKHILSVLRGFHYNEAVPKLVSLLESSQDEKLQADVLQTLESLTGRSFPNKPIQEQIFLWKRNTVSEMTF